MASMSFQRSFTRISVDVTMGRSKPVNGSRKIVIEVASMSVSSRRPLTKSATKRNPFPRPCIPVNDGPSSSRVCCQDRIDSSVDRCGIDAIAVVKDRVSDANSIG